MGSTFHGFVSLELAGAFNPASGRAEQLGADPRPALDHPEELGMTLTTVPITDDLLRGALELEPTDRGLVPHWLPAGPGAVPGPQLAMAESQPSGVRLALRTAATVVELDVLVTRREYVGAPLRPDGRFDLVVDGRPAGSTTAPGGDTWLIDMTTGSFDLRPDRWARSPSTRSRPARRTSRSGCRTTKGHPGRAPGRRTGRAAAGPRSAYLAPPRQLHQPRLGGHEPHGTWPAVAAALAGVDLVNLGFAGSALLDPSPRGRSATPRRTWSASRSGSTWST